MKNKHIIKDFMMSNRLSFYSPFNININNTILMVRFAEYNNEIKLEILNNVTDYYNQDLLLYKLLFDENTKIIEYAYKPKHNEEYFYIAPNNKIFKKKWNNEDFDIFCYKSKNVYKSVEETKKFL